MANVHVQAVEEPKQYISHGRSKLQLHTTALQLVFDLHGVLVLIHGGRSRDFYAAVRSSGENIEPNGLAPLAAVIDFKDQNSISRQLPRQHLST